MPTRAALLLFVVGAVAFVPSRAPAARRPVRLLAAEDDEARAAASEHASKMKKALAPGSKVAALDALEKCVADGGSKTDIGEKMFALLCYQTCFIRVEGEGTGSATLVPDEENACLDPSVPEVKQQFQYLYQYGFSLFAQGLLTEESLPRVVQSELCDRLGMDGEAFEAWLGVTV